MRIGHGFDVHKFGSDKPLVLAGVTVPYSQGLIAHSDGDVVLHAICDALLGAVALGDIGKLFPDTDPAYEGADSRVLLRECFAQVQALGFEIGNLDVTVAAQSPKLRPHIDSMRALIADDLDSTVSQINVKATTTEELGYVGRKEGIACHAVVLLVAKS
ncbi:2-C-methyl-D-erythritol 2,4-cyclodiphosphate synthase [Corallincola spongiicola]|uniref:2-C-methyl-D-erythritol 2,4-cyclodiphosphate synthase n=1 Tax=Corallincola spongiicola TaxID=2520508 RepID=A0ABY1WRJ9_9GAMM|nr:2-C-methyl-D-erythritol 2,4-cyclodiphosphate synthase [Corallincola spongiicola]TAA47362.1 2-C-methyl-D-erythritol 2,4-cyclodiphosphate synthase [Corallincola spongiicola]